MAIPALDDEGFLPLGIYDCTLAEIKDRFGQFRGSDCRPHLFRKLEMFVDEAIRSRLARSLIVNGSFTSGKEQPGDVDLVVVLPLAMTSRSTSARMPTTRYLADA